jgi:non-canonical (house-cleaning) NTP pyrophosphatase
MLGFRQAAIGSTNPANVRAVRDALANLAPDCVVLPVDVPSGAGQQPFGDTATRSGALERARRALSASDADIAFGLAGRELIRSRRRSSSPAGA